LPASALQIEIQSFAKRILKENGLVDDRSVYKKSAV
jgi:hypothetical protein